MLTNEQADATYQQAFAALHSVVIDSAATPEQQALAREKREVLTLEYIGQAIASVEERTRRFRKFIGEMNAVIAAFGSSSTIAGIRRLQEVVDAAGELIGAALAPLAPTPAKKAARKSARKAARKSAEPSVAKAAKKAAKKGAKAPSGKSAKKAAKKVAKKVAGAVPKKTPRKATKAAPTKSVKRPARTPAGARRRASAPRKAVRSVGSSPVRAARRRVR